MTLEIRKQANEKRQLMRSFLKKIVSNDERAKQLFKLYFDRNELSEEHFIKLFRIDNYLFSYRSSSYRSN